MGRRRKLFKGMPKNIPARMHFKHGAFYYIHKNKWTRLSNNYSESLAKWAELEGRGGIETEDTSVNAALLRYEIDIIPTLSATTQKEYRRFTQLLAQTYGAMKLTEVRPKDIASYLDHHSSKSAANKEIGMLSSVFTYAIRWGLCDVNPCKHVKRNSEPRRSRYIEDAEYLAVRSFCWDQSNEFGVYPWRSLAIAMDLSYLTSFRLSDILKIQIGHIDESHLKIIEEKTKWKARVPLTDDLRAVIVRAHTLRRRVTSMHLINSREGLPYTSNGFKSAWQRMMRTALKAGVIQERFTFHDLRAKHATDKDELGFNAQLALGHTDPKVTARYVRNKKGRIVPALKPSFDGEY